MFARRLLAVFILTIGGLPVFTGCSTQPSSVSGQDSGRTLTLSANTRWVLVKWTSAGVSKDPIHSPALTRMANSLPPKTATSMHSDPPTA